MVIEVVIPFLVFVLCHPCCAQSSASTANPRQTQFGQSCPAYKPNCGSRYDGSSDEFNCSSPDGLPCVEAYALRDFIVGLDLPDSDSIEFTRENCSVSTDSVSITCTCATNSSGINVCHVTAIVTRVLDLSNGIIHENVSMLSSLEKLNLGRNQLRCDIPPSLGKLKALKYLYLFDNFIHGPIPPSLGNLQSLLLLDLSDNMLSGEIPKELANLSALGELDLSNNMLSGEIPKALGNLSNLEDLNLEENQLTGNLPSTLGNLTNLEYLKLGSNYLTGNLQSYDKLSNIRTFDVGGNSLNGPIPDFISNWSNLTDLNLLGNDFEGNLPSEIFQMSNLQYLRVSDLKSTSDFYLPTKANLSSIYTLILRNCSILGNIPSKIIQRSYVSLLDLSFNNLTGPIPDSLQNVSRLLLTGNMLKGEIPSWVYEKGDDMDLSYNNFQNQSTKESGNRTMPNILPTRHILEEKRKQCSSTENYNLFINCGGGRKTFEGHEYDEDISQKKWYESSGNRWAYSCSGNFLSANANSSDYIKNKTCGVSDEALQETARLCPVSLTYYGFCFHNGNYTVKLQFAEIVFTKDEDSSSRSKRVFDVYVQGEKRLENFNIKSETGEPNKERTKELVAEVKDNLLVIHFYWAGKGSLDTPTLNGPLVSAIYVTPNFTISAKKLSTSQIAGITVGSVLAPILLLAFLWQMGWLGNRELQKVYVDVQGRRFTLQQIIDATRNFSPKTEIGRGRFGIVYKAELPDKIKLAVKKISPDSMQDKIKTELQGEIFNLKSLKHENLIQLFDGYSRKHLHLLIYECMEKGSVHQALLDPNSTTVLDWKVRFDICLGIAKALKYLHEENGLMILHRNIKASNILLDENYTAKLTDFGWARLYNEKDPFMTLRAGAARVYIAPEYAIGQPITDKADVYSYGVVALEVFSGRPGIEYKPNQEAAYLVDDARIAHAQRRIDKLVDRKMENYDRKAAFTVLNLAIICIHPTAELRPTMSEVVSVLSGEKKLEEISKVSVS